MIVSYMKYTKGKSFMKFEKVGNETEELRGVYLESQLTANQLENFEALVKHTDCKILHIGGQNE